MSHTDSTLLLGLEVELVQPARGRHLSPTEIRWADPLPTDHFASGRRGPCIDAVGYHRRRHFYAVWTRAGVRCCFCWRLRGWDPL